MRKSIKKSKDLSLEELEKLLKPSTISVICGTLVCLGPWGNLILRIVTKDNDNLLAPALLTFPTLILMCIQWFLYINHKKTYKQDAKDIFNNIDQNKP